MTDTTWPELGPGTVIEEGPQVSKVKWDNAKEHGIPTEEYLANKNLKESKP